MSQSSVEVWPPEETIVVCLLLYPIQQEGMRLATLVPYTIIYQDSRFHSTHTLLSVDLLFCSSSSLFFLPSTSSTSVLLPGILVLLSFPTAHTLGRTPLVTKGRPRPKVFAALAPFNVRVRRETRPHGHVTTGTDTLVLARDNVQCCFVVVVVSMRPGDGSGTET